MYLVCVRAFKYALNISNNAPGIIICMVSWTIGFFLASLGNFELPFLETCHFMSLN